MPTSLIAALPLTGTIPRLLSVIFTSWIPVIENKGGIALAAALHIRWYYAYICSTLASLVQLSFLLRMEHHLIEKCRRVPILSGMLRSVEQFTLAHEEFFSRHAYLALGLIVSIPISGIGCWEATLLSNVLGLKHKHARLAIALGILISSLLTTLSVYGLIVGLQWLF